MAEILLYIVLIGMVIAFLIVDQMSNRGGKNYKRMRTWSNILFVPTIAAAVVVAVIFILIIGAFILYGLATRA